MIIKGHWGGVGPLRLPYICTDPERSRIWDGHSLKLVVWPQPSNIWQLSPPPQKKIHLSGTDWFQGTDCKQFSADLIGTCHLQKGQFWKFSPCKDVNVKLPSGFSPMMGRPMVGIHPPQMVSWEVHFSSKPLTTILRKFHHFCQCYSTSVNDFAKFATRHKSWDLVIMIYLNRWS